MTSSPTTEISPLQVTSSREGLEGGLRLPEKLLQQVRGESDCLTAWVIVSVGVQAKHQYNTANYNRGLAEASSALETIIEMGDHYQTGLTRKLKHFFAEIVGSFIRPARLLKYHINNLNCRLELKLIYLPCNYQ